MKDEFAAKFILIIFSSSHVCKARAGHSLIFSRFAIRSPLNFFPWIADAHAFIFLISLFARRSNARRSTSSSLSEKGLNHSSLITSNMKFFPLPFFYNHLACQDLIPSLDQVEPVSLKFFFALFGFTMFVSNTIFCRLQQNRFLYTDTYIQADTYTH